MRGINERSAHKFIDIAERAILKALVNSRCHFRLISIVTLSG